jgi:hypothetical protein
VITSGRANRNVIAFTPLETNDRRNLEFCRTQGQKHPTEQERWRFVWANETKLRFINTTMKITSATVFPSFSLAVDISPVSGSSQSSIECIVGETVKERKPAELVIDPNQSIVQRGGGSG